MATNGASLGVLRVVNSTDTAAQVAEEARAKSLAVTAPTVPKSSLAGFIIDQYTMMRRHRDDAGSGWSQRLLQALRAFNGQYDPSQLQEIKKFGGSDVYARIIAMKCRGTSSLLRDVYLGVDRAWGLRADPDPDVPPEVLDAIDKLVHTELAGVMQGGGQLPEPNAIKDRISQLTEAARQAAKAKAVRQAKIAEDKLEEILDEGGFYSALGEFITDLPLFPYACMKGPTVRLRTVVQWVNGKAQVLTRPKLTWYRVSPFDVYWTPGVSDIADASVIERSRLTRAEVNELLDLPGYDKDEVRAVLDEYGRGGIYDNWDQTDAERAVLENRENPNFNQSGLLSCMEFQGNAQGRYLLEQGMDPKLISDPLRDYFVQAWMIGSHVIKVQLSPSPRKRHQYYITSFEKVPGTPVGNGLPEILGDIQNVCNAVLRSLVNNLAMSSGPQVTVNDDRIAPGADGDDMFPWKRWHVKSDPMGNNTEPAIGFFMPANNSQALMGVYAAWTELADEMSAIPRYMTGAQTGSIGRTASGLSMLMSNSAKILQTVAANIDNDCIEGILQGLYDMVMLTDTTGLLTGSEDIRVLGVKVALQKETERARQLEFLQVTANPIDMQIIGPKGRAQVLRPIADAVGLPGETIVPSDDQLDAQQKAAAMMAQQQGQPGHSLGNDGPGRAQGNQPSPVVNGNQGPVTNTVQPTIQGGPQ